MSRSVKDLRELICVSRLSLRVSDEETDELSDNEAAGDTARNQKIKQLIRPDTALSVRDERPTKPLHEAKKKSKKPQQQQQQQQQQQLEIKKKQPLPPLEKKLQQEQQQQKQLRYDEMMKFIDEETVSGLLRSALSAFEKLKDWTLDNHHFIHFANFWLTDFPDSKKMQIFQLEFSCLQDHFAVVFKSGINQKKLTSTDIDQLLSAVFREYPRSLLSAKAAHLFLNHLDLLTAARGNEYKQLLTDVRLSTDNKQYAELLLALRCFCLSSVWTAIVTFYQQLISRGDVQLLVTDVASFDGIVEERVVTCISLGYVDVLHYLILNGKVDPYEFVDKQGRSLIFIAVSCAQHRKDSVNQVRILKYLLKSLQPNPPVNAKAKTGNTALHCAISSANFEIVQLLVKHGGADVNAQNELCDFCTPLHLAVMYGNNEAAKYLLDNGGNAKLSMGNVNCLQMAEQNGDREMMEILEKFV